MREIVYVGLNFPPEAWPRAQELFRAMGRADLAQQGRKPSGYVLKFESELEFRRFQSKLRTLDPDPFVRRERIYTEAELQRASLLHLVVTRAPKADGGPRHGTEYDLTNACPRCGTGAVQTSPLVLKRSETPRPGADLFETLSGEVLISEDLAGVWDAAGIGGAELRGAVSHRDGQPLAWFQVIPQLELPPMSAQTRGTIREDPCPACGRDGHFFTVKSPEAIVYDDPESAEDLPDVCHTYERFGNSVLREPFASSFFAPPLLICKPNVQKFFRGRRVRGIRFIPVQLVRG